MGYRKILIFILMFSLLGAVSCSTNMRVPQAPSATKMTNTPVVKPAPIMLPKKAQIKAYEPFDGKYFTFSANNISIKTVLFAIAMDAGLNLVINPDVKLDDSITANFVRTPMKDALDTVLDVGDLFYVVKGNVMQIQRYSTVNFNLPYISSISKKKSSLGGDIIGNAGDTGLKGDFSLEFEKKDEASDFFKQAETNIKAILADDKNSYYTVNTMSGIITVYTTRSKMKRINNLLDNVISNVNKQVLIEAKIIEVNLADGWEYGINWSALLGGMTLSQVPAMPTPAGQLSVVSGSISGVVNAIASYNKIDTLANPRMTVMSGQSAMITAGTITPYWERTAQTKEGAGGSLTTEYTYTKTNILEGVLIGVTAFVHDDDSVTMNVVPVSTSKEDEKKVIDEITKNVYANAPVMNIKEAGTIVKVNNGSLIVLGGLISDNKVVKDTRIPLLGDIPWLGYLFRSQSVSYQKKELVILLKPTVIQSDTRVTIR